MSLTVEVKGLKELQDALKAFEKEIQGKILAVGTYKSALVFKNYAISNAPMHPWPHKVKAKGGGYETVQPGHLRRNIIIRKIKVAGGAMYAVTIRKVAYYAKFLEFGTSKMAKRSFMRPAFDGNTTAAIAAFKDHLARGIDKWRAKVPRHT